MSFLRDEVFPRLLARGYAAELFAELGQGTRSGDNVSTTCPRCQKKGKFSYSLSKPVWQCWSCAGGGFSGDWLSWLTDHKGYSFEEALKFLAEAAGVELKTYDKQAHEEKRRAQSLNEAAQQFFTTAITREVGRADWEYLQQRGYTKADVEAMGLGSYRDKEKLQQYLMQQGFAHNEIFNSALLRTSQFGSSHTLTLPWTDVAGRIEGFAMRTVLSDDEQAARGVKAKYWYSQGMEKSAGLVGLPACRNRKRVLLVEGPLDALLLNARGMHAIALGGNMINERQIRAIENSAIEQLVLCLDGDARGREGTAKALYALGVEGEARLRPFVASLPEGSKDPDELVRAQGIEPLQAAMEQALYWPAWLGANLAFKFDCEGALGRDDALSEAAGLYSRIREQAEREEFGAAAALACGFSEQAIIERAAKINQHKSKTTKQSDKPPDSQTQQTGAGVVEAAGSGDTPPEQQDGLFDDSYYSIPPESSEHPDQKRAKFKSSPRERRWLRLSDLGLGERFAEQFGERVKYIAASAKQGSPATGCWLWDGRRWRQDETLEVHRMASSLIEVLIEESKGYPPESRPRKALEAFAIQTESSKAHDLTVKMGVAQAGMQLVHEQLDQDPWLLNCPNGIIDLKRGTRHQHRPEKLLTKLAGTEMRDTPCPNWLRFLHWAMGWPDDGPECLDSEGKPREPQDYLKEAIELGEEGYKRCVEASAAVRAMQRLFGYLLSGDASHQHWYFFFGFGWNGKGLVLRMLDLLLGDYAWLMKVDVLQPRQNSRQETALANLRGARLAYVDELDQHRPLDEALIKQITGGGKVQGRFLYNNEFNFVPQFKLVVAANHKPGVKGSDTGFWRRVVFIPFPNRKTAETADLRLFERDLAPEAPGVLAWAVEGCRQWLENEKKGIDPLDPPPQWREAAREYRHEQDVAAQFIEARLVEGEELTVDFEVLLQEYTDWAEKQGISPQYRWSKRRLNQELEQHAQINAKKFFKDRSGALRFWRGLGVSLTRKDE